MERFSIVYFAGFLLTEWWSSKQILMMTADRFRSLKRQCKSNRTNSKTFACHCYIQRGGGFISVVAACGLHWRGLIPGRSKDPSRCHLV
jgi:hypothetical protein